PAGIGWAVIRDGIVILEGSRCIGHVTNPIAEILAAAEALQSIPSGCNVQIRTDSLYVINTMTKGWMRKASRNHWTILDAVVARQAHVHWVHVRGHRGERWNEYVDRLASTACLEQQRQENSR